MLNYSVTIQLTDYTLPFLPLYLVWQVRTPVLRTSALLTPRAPLGTLAVPGLLQQQLPKYGVVASAKTAEAGPGRHHPSGLVLVDATTGAPQVVGAEHRVQVHAGTSLTTPATGFMQHLDHKVV